MGRLAKDPEIRYTQSNKPVCSFTLAVDRRFSKDKKADFINCQAWDKTAEFIGKYFSKGSMIAVVGRIQTRSWEDKDGKKHYITEVVVEETYFTGSKNESQKQDEPVKTNTNSGFYPEDDSLDDLPF